jgi:hypothetical protein
MSPPSVHRPIVDFDRVAKITRAWPGQSLVARACIDSFSHDIMKPRVSDDQRLIDCEDNRDELRRAVLIASQGAASWQ